MNTQGVINFIQDYTGLKLNLKPWHQANSLPLFMSANYSFYIAQNEPEDILFVAPKATFSYTSLFNVYRNLTRSNFQNHRIIYVLPNTSQYILKRLTNSRISFIIPGKRIYAPFLGMIYQNKIQSKYANHVISQKGESVELTPSTLSVYLFMIKNGFKLKQSEIIKSIGISRMTLYRAYKELMREKMIIMNENKEMQLPLDWKLNYRSNCLKFKNPIRRTIYLDRSNHETLIKHERFFTSSESALNEFSDMAEPMNDSYAVYWLDWDTIQNEFIVVAELEHDSIILEIWSIPVPNENGYVIPLALYLTLVHHPDERIKMAIEYMLDKELSRYD